jgi:hypothetical protein
MTQYLDQTSEIIAGIRKILLPDSIRINTSLAVNERDSIDISKKKEFNHHEEATIKYGDNLVLHLDVNIPLSKKTIESISGDSVTSTEIIVRLRFFQGGIANYRSYSFLRAETALKFIECISEKSMQLLFVRSHKYGEGYAIEWLKDDKLLFFQQEKARKEGEPPINTDVFHKGHFEKIESTHKKSQ